MRASPPVSTPGREWKVLLNQYQASTAPENLPSGQQEPAAPGIALRSQCAHNASRMKPATAEASADYSIFALLRRPSADEALSRTGNRILADNQLRHATDEHIRRQRGRRRPNGRGTDRPVLQREHLQ